MFSNCRPVGKMRLEKRDFRVTLQVYTVTVMPKARRFISFGLVALMLALPCLLTGCESSGQLNPSFPLSVGDANDALKEMRDNPQPFDRPVLVIGGWLNSMLMTSRLAGAVRSVGADNIKLTHVSMLTSNSFEKCRVRVIDAVDDELGTTQESVAANETIEVDVVAFSMGGLVARYAAAPRTDGRKRLRIRRLFTISTPHCGANMAPLAGFEARAADMRHGSALLALLNEYVPPPDYDIIAYVRLGDMTVGQENCALPGCNAWWVPNRMFEAAHNNAFSDPRILADIARRLRGETPFTRTPAAPLP